MTIAGCDVSCCCLCHWDVELPGSRRLFYTCSSFRLSFNSYQCWLWRRRWMFLCGWRSARWIWGYACLIVFIRRPSLSTTGLHIRRLLSPSPYHSHCLCDYCICVLGMLLSAVFLFYHASFLAVYFFLSVWHRASFYSTAFVAVVTLLLLLLFGKLYNILFLSIVCMWSLSNHGQFSLQSINTKEYSVVMVDGNAVELI